MVTQGNKESNDMIVNQIRNTRTLHKTLLDNFFRNTTQTSTIVLFNIQHKTIFEYMNII